MIYTVTKIGREQYSLTVERHVCDFIWEIDHLGDFKSEVAAWKSVGL